MQAKYDLEKDQADILRKTNNDKLLKQEQEF